MGWLDLEKLYKWWNQSKFIGENYMNSKINLNLEGKIIWIMKSIYMSDEINLNWKI